MSGAFAASEGIPPPLACRQAPTFALDEQSPVRLYRGMSDIYLSAVRGRQQFREAYRRELAKNRALRAALVAVRVKALPAGAAVGLRREGWQDRCNEVLDIIDGALENSE